MLRSEHHPVSLKTFRRRGFSRLVGLASVASVTLGLATLTPRTSLAQSKIAVVDVQRAVLETEEGLRVQATLKKLFDQRQIELDSKQRALQDEKEALDKEARVGKTSKEAIQKKYETLQRQAAELQTLMVDYQREMQRKQNEMTTPIVQRVMGIVRRIATQDGYEIVLEKAAVPYFRGDLELTDRAIQMYNSGQGGDTSTPGTAPTPPTDGSKTTPAPTPKKK